MRSVRAHQVALARERAAAEREHHLADRGRVGDARAPEPRHADDARARRDRVDGDRLALARAATASRSRRCAPSARPAPGARARRRSSRESTRSASVTSASPSRNGPWPSRWTMPADSSVASSREAVLALTPIRRASSLTPSPSSLSRSSSSSASARATDATGRARRSGLCKCCAIGNSIALVRDGLSRMPRSVVRAHVSALRRPRGRRLRVRRRGERSPARDARRSASCASTTTSAATSPACSASGGTTAPAAARGFRPSATPARTRCCGSGCPGSSRAASGCRHSPASGSIAQRDDHVHASTASPSRRFEGDTIGSALYAAGRRTFSRSFKYHRRRGLMCCAGNCPNCLVAVDGAPGVRACTEPVREGMRVEHLNASPGLELDAMSVTDTLGGPFTPPGFYYKTFIRPRRLWPLYEWVLRHAAGLGRLPETQAERHWRTEYRRRHADVLVVGGGARRPQPPRSRPPSSAPTSCSSTRAPSRAGGCCGRAGTSRRAHSPQRAAQPASRSSARRPALGHFDGLVPVWQGDTLHQIRARQHIYATGAIEQPLVFAGNDLPGVMLSSGARRLAALYGVRPGDARRGRDAPPTAACSRRRSRCRRRASSGRASPICAPTPSPAAERVARARDRDPERLDGRRRPRPQGGPRRPRSRPSPTRVAIARQLGAARARAAICCSSPAATPRRRR